MRKWNRIDRLTAFGAPIFVHWSAIAVTALLAIFALNSPILASLAIASYFAVIVIHELGHAFVAHRLGYEVVAIRVGAIHGLCEHTAPDYEWDDVLIAWGGVWAQLCVALVVFVVAFLLSDRRPGYFGPILAFLGYVNLLVALANLAPGAGFDGTKAWRIVPLLVHRWRAKRAASKTLLRIVKRK